ncbi:MAG TPA: hypothetical protein DDY98_08985, partial [Ruminococcaceae bacterium]|nr:hypothetical protein [Oscillospiraceae bacterium]
MATQKSAQDYREERKARLAKSAKQNSKKSHRVNVSGMKQQTKNIITLVICIVAALAIAVVACFNLGVFERFKTIKTVDGKSYSAVEYEYYYKSTHYYYLNMSNQYDSYYGEGYGVMYTGYDSSKLPEDQEYVGTDFTLEDGTTPTWKQYFEHIALLNLRRTVILADMAAKEGYNATEEETSEAASMLDDLRQDIKDNAEENGSQAVSLGKYLRSNYGKGMSEAAFQKIVDRETLANSYYQDLLERTGDGYADDVIEAEYNKDKSAYDSVDFRLFTVAAETPELGDDATTEETQAAQTKAAETAKKQANEMFGKIKDSASFKTLAEQYATATQKESVDYSDDAATLTTYARKETISGSLPESVVTWLYADSTKVGDKKLFDEDGTYYLLLMVKSPYKDNTNPVDVRHILYQFDSEAEDAAADKAEKKASAEAALKKINESSDKLATFLELCAAESADTGSNQNGGLYEKVGRGQYVKAFEAWALDPDRKEGDIGIVETEYGYHVMYFEKAYTKPYWHLTIGETLADKEVTETLEKAYESKAYAVEGGDKNAMLVKLN